jgi:hypothetical protein
MNWFRREPPPPPIPFYRKSPVATMAVILTIVITFILGPVTIIYNGMAEDLKEKANNETILLYMKQQKETDDRQWKAIEQQIQVPKSMLLQGAIVEKPPLSPEEFQQYIKMSTAEKTAFRKLHPSYATLPR